MAEKICSDCGKEYENKSNPWYECSGCGAYHCPDCLQEHMGLNKEKDDIEKDDIEKE